MRAAEGIKVRPVVVRIVKAAVVGLLIPIWRNGRSAADAVGIRPGAVRADRGNVLTEHERVARAIGNIRQALLLHEVQAEEEAVAALQAIAIGNARNDER